MDEDAIRREFEHSGNDEDYLSELDEEFCDLSSEEDNGVNQVSRAQPSCKKARISVRTLSVDSENSEGKISVVRTERRDKVTVTVKQMLPFMVEMVVLEAMMAMKKKQKAMVLIVNVMMQIWMSVILVILLYIQGKATAQTRNSYKNVTQKE
jgi:hypothetical protein